MESKRFVKCHCGNEFSEDEFRIHYIKCEKFKKQFKEFDNQFCELLESYTQQKENLLIVKYFLSEYINIIEKKIKKYLLQENIKCHICKINKFDTYLSCTHPICKKCFLSLAEENYLGMKCKECNELIENEYKETILGIEKCKELEQKAILGSSSQNFAAVTCPKCKEVFCFEKGKVDYTVKDNENNLLSKAAAEDYAEHRCRCPMNNCNAIFCVSCSEIPYHLGYTCSEFNHIKNALKCRFCEKEMNSTNRGPSINCCNQKECIERYENSCKKTLKCGHKCFGVNGEIKCPPCLIKECKDYKNVFDQDSSSYCNICFIEGLGSAPMIVLSCGHYVHFHCVKHRLEDKWLGPKITFNHCLCPSCNKWLDCKSVTFIHNLISENKKLYEDIKSLALKRLSIEHLDKDKRLSDPNSPWYNKKEEFAMKRLSYYMCYKCKKPYFAGRRECGDGPMVNENDPNKKYDPKDCICGKCTDMKSNVLGITDCPKHGKEFIEYKCRFCCKIASWFCWGTTHFCDDCHQRQCAGDYISKYPKEALAPCDPKTCEAGGNHPPNGDEYAIGCSLCRNES